MNKREYEPILLYSAKDEDQIQANRRQIENYKDQIDQLHKLLEKQQTLLAHEQQLRLTKIKPETKQLDGQPKKKHWWSFK